VILYVNGYISITNSKYFYSYLSQNNDNMNKHIEVVTFQAPFPTCLKKVLIYATYVQCNDLACSHNHCCSGNVTTYFAFLPHYVINNMVFGKHWLKIKCVFGFSLQPLTTKFPTLKRIQIDIFINVHRSAHKVPIILVRF
jgi:hypothetical protein